MQYHSYVVKLLRKGLPPTHEPASLSSDSCVAVFPNISRPLDRSPLEPSFPLPWSDCYHSLHDEPAEIRIPACRADNQNATKLSLEEVFRHRKLEREERKRRNPSSGLEEDYRRESEAQEKLYERYRFAWDLREKQEDEASPGDVLILESTPHDYLPIADASYDLSLTSTPADPQDFFIEHRTIEE